MPSTPRLRVDQRPLYVQAGDAIRKHMRAAGYRSGDRLPSELQLSQQLGISRPTLREALRRLEEEGAIQRRHGVGTFVTQPRPVIETGLEVLESIISQADRSGLSTRMGGLEVAERPADEAEQHGLSSPAAEPVTTVARVILTGNQPAAYLVDVLPQRFFRPDDLPRGFQGSVLDALRVRGWPALSHSRTELMAEVADPALARALGVLRGAPLMKVEAQLFAADGQIVDYSIGHFLPGRFRFHVVRRIPAA